MIGLGYGLKRFKLTNDQFLNTSDRMIYFVFFPVMLFWKIGGAATGGQTWPLVGAALCALAVIYGLSCVCIRLFNVTDFQAGSFSQSCYRFNTYIGIAIIITALGETGVAIFGILIGVMIPIINVLAVSTLIWFSGKQYAASERNRILLRALVSNPLIIGCAAGIVYNHTIGVFPMFIDNSLRLASLVTLPLALLSIGGSLTFGSFGEYLKPSVVSSALKLAVLPAAGWLFMTLFGVATLPFKVGLIFFALPTSTAIYVLSSQLNSDTKLASASIVLSTLFSIASLTVALFAL